MLQFSEELTLRLHTTFLESTEGERNSFDIQELDLGPFTIYFYKEPGFQLRVDLNEEGKLVETQLRGGRIVKQSIIANLYNSEWTKGFKTAHQNRPFDPGYLIEVAQRVFELRNSSPTDSRKFP